jgi:PAS domain S-box-containing protein
MDVLHTALLAATAEPCVILDRNGRVVRANKAMANRLGLPAASLVGGDVFTLFPREVAERRRAVMLQAFETGKRVCFEDETSSGATFTAVVEPVRDESGHVPLVVVVVHDISEPKRAEEQRFRLANAIEQTLEAIILLDDDFNIQYVNQSFEAMTGYPQREATGKNISILYKGEEQTKRLQSVLDYLDHADIWAGRTRNTRKDGSVFECDKTVSRIRYKRSKTLGYVSVWRDVTEMTALERQLRQAQKMEAIATLAGGLAHDFNNILGPIILHAELCMQGLDAEDPMHASLCEILDAANRARGLVGQILGLGRQREQDKPIPFSLGSIVKECLKLLKPSLPPNVMVIYRNEAESDILVADPSMIHQLLMNLCTNAAHAMESQGGELSISMRDQLVELRPKDYQAVNPGSYVRLEVRDTGCGIPREDLHRIFDPFFTSRHDGKGTGLGLAVVQNIVSSLNGAIDVTSTPGKGSCFTVLLPRREDFETLLEATASGNGHHAGLHIMLVDDDALMAQGARAALAELGHRITVSSNAFEALALFRQYPDNYDLVIAELGLAEMDGMDLTREILFNRPEMPVFLSTSYSENSLQERARACGAQAVICKPFRMDELRRRLETLCADR